MQAENNKYRPDKQFTDHSWLEMRKLLDKEMPVENKKRRGFFWIFFFLGIGLVSSIWAFYPKKSEEIVDSQSQNIYAEKNEIKQIDEEKNITESKKEADDFSNKEINNDKKNYKTKTTKQSRKNNFIKKEKSVIAFQEIKKVEKSPTSTELETKIIFEKVVLPAMIEPLTSLLDIAEKEQEENLGLTIANACPKERKISFGINGGTLWDFSDKDDLGSFAGIKIHFPIGKRFGIRTGVNYSIMKKDQSFNFSGQQQAAVREYFDFINPELEAVSVFSHTNFILEEMHYLELPIMLTYVPHRKIQFHIGAQGSYLVKNKVKSFENNLGINQPNDVQVLGSYDLSTVDLRTVSFRQYKDENFWNRFDVSSVVGVAWKPKKWLSFELQYHRGWLKYLDTNQEGFFEGNAESSDSNNPYSVSNIATTSADNLLPSNNENLTPKNLNHSLRLGIGIEF